MRFRFRVSGWLAVCVQLLCIPGCSFWAVRGPDRSVRGGGDCSTSVVAPVVDGVLAASLIGLGVAGAATPSCNPQARSTGFYGPCFLDFSGVEQAAGGGMIALGVLEAVAASYGAIRVSACNDAKKQLGPPISRSVAAPAFHLGTDPGPDPSRLAGMALAKGPSAPEQTASR